MHLEAPLSSGSAGTEPLHGEAAKPLKQFKEQASSLPFGQSIPLSSISGPTYLTAQTLIQQVAYLLSDKLFTYSPETFDLDAAVKEWSAHEAPNAHGDVTGVVPMQTRTGAGSIALGYIFSNDFDLKKRYIPQGVIASTSSLLHLRSALDQLSLLYSVANPFVAHIAAVDYTPASGLVTDYASALTLAEELGFGLVSSASPYEAQHMSLFSTLLANVLPTVHIYDGISVGRETTRVIDVLGQAGLFKTYKTILDQISGPAKKQKNASERVQDVLEAFNDELGTPYGLFEYEGHASAESILVVFGTVEASLGAQIASSLAKKGIKVGILNVRVYRPFVEEEFLKALPDSVRSITVLGQVHDRRAVSESAVHSSLYSDVLAAITFSAKWPSPPKVLDFKYAREQTWTPKSLTAIFQQLVSKSLAATDVDLDLSTAAVQQFTFWDVDDSAAVNAPVVLGQLLSKDSSNNVTVKTGHDNLVEGGVIRTDLRTSKKSIEAPYSVEKADVAYVGEEKLLAQYEVVDGIKAGGKLLVRLPGLKDDQLEKRLPVGFRKVLRNKNVQLFIFDPQALEAVAEDESLETYLAQVAFLRVAHSDLLSTGLGKLSTINGSQDILGKLVEQLDSVLGQAEVPESWATIEPEVEIPSLPADITRNSFAPFSKVKEEPPTFLRSWETAAQGLAFKEVYGAKTALRPDLAHQTFTVHVKENRRLTPESYDRNIFHIEFDLGESGLKYNIGEALGIHATNNEDEVKEFIKFYNLDPENIVEVPSREDPDVLENRTIYQALMQNVDIFGRPPKRFYEALAEFADDPNEKKELLALGGPEGATEFKRRAEVDTVTYADILLEFPSAHPSFHDIVRIVAPLKRREYSIASSQQVNPKTVSLLIVVVSWTDPKGRDRFGQATRFLNALKPGAPVVVSVKPSVMKLPPQSTQPLIMAGLGTGLAPFRAFVQYRAWQKSQGIPIGAVLLYMGSRHQREEYLFGEEWEAYQDAGVITLLGRAFSRDQAQKIYIQDRMRESLGDIVQAYIKEQGAFYLCGPTWPVPDVTAVLEEAIKQDAKSTAGAKKVDARKEIERLKEEERYVLEVY
ncbi:MAG: hypothetical protein M1819_001850 [Sarea resinae]|nr:MAG: hypothetical protein M1819_001850 [Sarea resinae]